MTRPFVIALATLLFALAAADATAHGRHHHHHGSHGGWYPSVALAWGVPYARYPYGYPYPYAYPYGYGDGVTTVVVEREPLVYVEREPAPAPAVAPTGPTPLWFYCPDPAGYYPHVASCNQRWVTVDPASVAGPARQ